MCSKFLFSVQTNVSWKVEASYTSSNLWRKRSSKHRDLSYDHAIMGQNIFRQFSSFNVALIHRYDWLIMSRISGVSGNCRYFSFPSPPPCSLRSPCMMFTDQVISTSTTQRPPVELHDIGYLGTWEQFCDKRLINKDFEYYPQHELRLLRLMICDRKEKNEINRRKMGPFVAYKYCELVSESLMRRGKVNFTTYFMSPIIRLCC